MLERFDTTAILQLIGIGFFFALGWAALNKLWALLGDRGQLIVAVIVLVVILVAVVLAYRGA
jgi:hypothetical protein